MAPAAGLPQGGLTPRHGAAMTRPWPVEAISPTIDFLYENDFYKQLIDFGVSRRGLSYFSQGLSHFRALHDVHKDKRMGGKFCNTKYLCRRTAEGVRTLQKYHFPYNNFDIGPQVITSFVENTSWPLLYMAQSPHIFQALCSKQRRTKMLIACFILD